MVVEEVLEKHSPKKPSITLNDLYRRYIDDPARSRSKKTVMTYQSVYNVLMELFGKGRLIAEISILIHVLHKSIFSCRT